MPNTSQRACCRCLLPTQTLLATTRDIPPEGGIFNFCKTTIQGILKILVAFSGYFSVTLMRHSCCWESLALRSCFSRESTRIGKSPREWTKLSDECHQSKYITIHTRRKYYIIVANLTHSLQILKRLQLSFPQWI